MRPRELVGVFVLVLLLLIVPAHPQTKSANFNGDLKVDFTDFVLFARAFGGTEDPFDLNSDGSVNFPDFVLFAQEFGKTLSSDAPEWAQIEATNTGPPARFYHTLSLDPKRNRLLVFGGRGPTSLADTWIFDLDGRSWREVIASPSPSARNGYAAIYDAPRDRIIIFGGQNAGFFNDVWAFDLENETWQELAASGTSPSTRYGTSAIYDAPRNRMVVSHGFTSQGRFDDTWAFDLATNTWTDITPTSGSKPLKRCLHRAVYDASGDRMLLFGGCSSGFGPCPQGDLWAFDLKTNVWTELQPPGDTPSARTDPSMAYDPTGKRGILFGGRNSQSFLNDTWSFDVVAQQWTLLSVEGGPPSPRKSHDAVVDSTNGRLLMFGGTGTVGTSDDLWELKF